MLGFREQSRCQFGRSSRLGGLSWSVMAAGLRPEAREPEAHEPQCCRQGWQHEAASRVEEEFREALFPDLSASRQALLRSQSDSGAGAAFSVTPSSIPGAAPTAPPPSSASVKSHLQMWPSTRLFWTPWRSLRSDYWVGGVPLESASAEKEVLRWCPTCWSTTWI